MCGSDILNKLGAVSFPAIEKAVRYACDISRISALKEKWVEVITALMRKRYAFVCLPMGYAMQLYTPIVSVRQLLGVQLTGMTWHW